MRFRFAAIVLVTSMFLNGCSTLDGRQNFRDIIGSDVGKDISHLRYAPSSQRELDENTLEYQYRCCSKTCNYYYQIDKKTNVVKSFSYEGDCYINP